MKTYEIPITFTINENNADNACQKLFNMLEIKVGRNNDPEYIEVMQSMINEGVREVKYHPYEYEEE